MAYRTRAALVTETLTPALLLQAITEHEAWRGFVAKLEQLAALEESRPLLPENARKVIDAVAPFVEEGRQSVLDDGAVLADLQAEDFQKYREVMVATLTPEESANLAKMSAGVQRPPSAPPAVSKHQSHSQMRSPDGKFRESRWRRVLNGSSTVDTSAFRFFR